MSNKKTNDMLSLTLRTAAEHIGLAISTKKPLMLWGLMGTGKSAIVKQETNKLKRKFIDIRLTTLEPSEFSGIPYYDSCEKALRRAVSDLFPTDEDSNAVILLDELPDANPSMQSAAYRLILDRELGNGRKLPEDVVILAAGNTAASHGGGGNMLSPLANRLDHIEIDVHTNEWLEDFGYENVHPLITSFLRKSPDAIHTYENKSQKAFGTPRSWVNASDKLFHIEETRGRNSLGSPFAEQAIASSVGCSLLAQFRSHVALDGKLPDMQDVINGTAKNIAPKLLKEAGIKYLLTSNVLSALYRLAKQEDEGWEGKVKNVLNYLEKNKDGEDMAILILSNIYRNDSDTAKKLKSAAELDAFLSPEVIKAITGSTDLEG